MKLTNKSDAPASYKQSIQTPDVNEVSGLLRREGTSLIEQVHKEGSDTTVNVKD